MIFLTLLSACAIRPSPTRESRVTYGFDLENPSRQPSSYSPRFDWPVDSAQFTRGYFTGTRRPHFGIDLAGPKGSAIISAQDGVVIYTGRDFKGFGKMVLVESGYGWATLYAHLDTILVREGQRVQQGEVVGSMGRTGRATGVHLHFEIRKNKAPVDPLNYLPNGRQMVEKFASI